MKKILSIFFALLIALSAVGADRYANGADVIAYAASTHGQLMLNDKILDTPFSTSGGYGQIFISDLPATFGSLPAGGTIWIDGANLPDLYSVFIANSANGNAIWSNGSSKANPVKIRPLGDKVKTVMTASTNTARVWVIADFEHVEVNGFLEAYPGMKYNTPQWSLNGTFGFEISGGTILSDQPFQILIDVASGGSMSMKNMEISGGFCGIRAVPGNTSLTMSGFEMRNMYIHDIVDAEGGYIGQTTGTPYAKFKSLKVRDVIIARSGAEGMQLQHMLKDTDRAYQENFVMYSAGSKWLDAFQQFQDNGLQHVADEGNITVRNAIIDGVPNSPISLISSSGGTPGTDPVIFQNILVNDSRDLGVYGGSSMQYGVNYEFRDMYFRAANNTYSQLTETAVNTHFVSMNGTDRNDWINTTYDNSKASCFESNSQLDDMIGLTQDNTMPAPSYNKGPFPGKTASDFMVYSEEYPSWSSRTGDKVSYTAGLVVRRDLVGTGQRFYVCTLGHTSSAATHPESDAVHWEPVTWDSNCFPSYHASWTSGGTQKYYPCDDFRLTADSYWNLKGMGLKSNLRNTNTSTYQWYINDSASETGMKAIAGQVDPKNFEVSSEDKGRYIRCKSYFKPVPGQIIEQWLDSWTLVN